MPRTLALCTLVLLHADAELVRFELLGSGSGSGSVAGGNGGAAGGTQCLATRAAPQEHGWIGIGNCDTAAATAATALWNDAPDTLGHPQLAAYSSSSSSSSSSAAAPPLPQLCVNDDSVLCAAHQIDCGQREDDVASFPDVVPSRCEGCALFP